MNFFVSVSVLAKPLDFKMETYKVLKCYKHKILISATHEWQSMRTNPFRLIFSRKNPLFQKKISYLDACFELGNIMDSVKKATVQSSALDWIPAIANQQFRLCRIH